MKIVIAPDSFKGSLSSPQAARAIEVGWRRVFPGAEVLGVPMADGGEGTVAALVEATGGRLVTVPVSGPLGEEIEAQMGLLGGSGGAVIEMAAASGLTLVPPGRRDPLRASTRGTGELIAAALERGCRRVLLGIGGSASTDGGAGMAQALGARLLDAAGEELPPGGAALARLERIDLSTLDPRVRAVEFAVACDVDNPLCGPRGAARVYAPQKGAGPEDVALLDAALERLAGVVARDLGIEIETLPGAGAAGGLGGGAVCFLGARLESGVDLVVAATKLEEKLAGADLVLTGEGSLDGQTLCGKTPLGVARAARRRGVPVVALAGRLGPGAEGVLAHGIDALMSLVPGPMSVEEAMREGENLLAAAAERLARLLALGWGGGAKSPSVPPGARQ